MIIEPSPNSSTIHNPTQLQLELNEETLKKVAAALNNNHTVQWLRKRFTHTSKIQYLNRPQELKKQIDIQNVFKKFDEDGSNSLDVNEVHEMFQQNGINIDEETLKKLFSIVDKQNKGSLDLDKFQQFVMSNEANSKFRKVIKILRKQEEEKPQQNKVAFLPFDFSSLLNYLSQKTQREKLLAQVDQQKISIEDTVEDIKAFDNLFKLKAQADANDMELPIQKEVKVRCEIEKMRPGIYSHRNKYSNMRGDQIEDKQVLQKLSQNESISERQNNSSFQIDAQDFEQDKYSEQKLRVKALTNIYKDKNLLVNGGSQSITPNPNFKQLNLLNQRDQQKLPESVKIKNIIDNYTQKSLLNNGQNESEHIEVFDEKSMDQSSINIRIEKKDMIQQLDQMIIMGKSHRAFNNNTNLKSSNLKQELDTILENNEVKLRSQTQSQKVFGTHRKSLSMDQKPQININELEFTQTKDAQYKLDSLIQQSQRTQSRFNQTQTLNKMPKSFLQYNSKKHPPKEQELLTQAKRYFKLSPTMIFKQESQSPSNQLKQQDFELHQQYTKMQLNNRLDAISQQRFKRKDFIALKEQKLQNQVIQKQDQRGLTGLDILNQGSPSRNRSNQHGNHKTIDCTKNTPPKLRISFKNDIRAFTYTQEPKQLSHPDVIFQNQSQKYPRHQFLQSFREQVNNPTNLKSIMNDRVTKTFIGNQNSNIKENDVQLLRTYRKVHNNFNKIENYQMQQTWSQVAEVKNLMTNSAVAYDLKNNHSSLEKLHKFKYQEPFQQVFKRNQEIVQQKQKSERRKFIKEIIQKRQNNLMVSEAQSVIKTIEQITNTNQPREETKLKTQRRLNLL
eukprot:403339235